LFFHCIVSPRSADSKNLPDVTQKLLGIEVYSVFTKEGNKWAAFTQIFGIHFDKLLRFQPVLQQEKSFFS